MQHLEVSSAVRHIYVIRWLKVKEYRGVVSCVVWSQIYEGTFVTATLQTNSSLSGFIAVCLFRDVLGT